MPESTVEDARGGFIAHAALYVLVMAALIVLNFSFLAVTQHNGEPRIGGRAVPVAGAGAGPGRA